MIIKTRVQALKVLGLERNATQDEIKKAYHKLAKELHSDKLLEEKKELDRLKEKKDLNKPLSKSEEDQIVQLTEKLEKFKEISLAHRILSNNNSRNDDEWSWEEEIALFEEMLHEINKRCDIVHKSLNKTTKNRDKAAAIIEQVEISTKICEKILKPNELSLIGKTEEINELQKRHSYLETCIKLFKEIESVDLEYCSSIIKEVTIADDIESLVQIAIMYDNVKVFELLSEKRTKVSLHDNLSNATKCCSERISHFLFDKYVDKMDVKYKDGEGNTALHFALRWLAQNESRYQNFVKSLLSKGARLDVKNNEGKTPFDLLLDCANKLFSIKEKVERLNYVSALLSDCKIDEPKELGGNPALNELVKLAVEYRQEGIFNLLVKNNIQISNLSDERGNTALHHALNELVDDDHYKYESFTRFLLSKGVRLDVENKKGKTPFDLLLSYVRKYFHQWRNDKRDDNFFLDGFYNPLQRLDLVVRLLSGHKGILKGLNGTPALNILVDTVIDCDHREALDLLVENNIQISSTTLKNIVTRDCNKKIFGCFLHKSKIDYQDESGNTVLHYALRHFMDSHYDLELYKVVELLASEGARFDIKNNKGETPFDLLIEYVEKGFYGQASRLSYAWKLLNKCENKDVLRELKYKDGTPALDKLNELRIKCRNTSIIVASTLAVVGVTLGVAIAVYSGMLAVGIGIGVCCLIVTAIIYHCNSPANLLENSNAEAITNDVTAEKFALK